MLAPPEQLRRWSALLNRPTTASDATADALLATLNADTGRRRILAALTAIECCERDASLVAFLTEGLAPLPPVPDRRPAVEGLAVADAVWQAYLRSRLVDAAADAWMDYFIGTLAPTALVFTIHDNPEPWWQAEMILLHAAHSYALRKATSADSLLDKTLACADFHLREIQPDHATNEPWSVHAYASHADGNVTAETLLHAGHIQHGGTLGPVARLVARDAGTSLAAFLDR